MLNCKINGTDHIFFLKKSYLSPRWTKLPHFFSRGVFPSYFHVISDFCHVWGPLMAKIEKMCQKSAFLVVPSHRGLRYDFLRKKIWTVPLILQFDIFSLPDPLTHFFLVLVLICQNCFESIEWKEHSFKYIKRYIDALTTPKGCAATTSTSPTFSLPSFPQQLFPYHPLCSAWNRPSYQF